MAEPLNSTSLTVIQQVVLDHLSALNLPQGSRILDAPCGSAAALSLALQKQGFSIVGSDLDLNAQVLLCDSFVPADLNKPLPWPDASFDVVISTEGIEHVENHFAFLSELHRILRPGGLLILTTPNLAQLRSRIRFWGSAFFGGNNLPLNESARRPAHHISLVTFPQLRYELHMSGFAIREARHTHIKPISYCYAIFAPWA